MMHKLLKKSMMFDGPETAPGGPVDTPAPAVTPQPSAEPVPAATEPAPAAEPPEPATVPIAAVKDERKKRQEAEAEVQRLREQNAYYQGLQASTPAPATPVQSEPAGPPVPPPPLDLFEGSFEEWQAADRQYIIDVATHNARTEMEHHRVAQRQQEASEATTRTFQERLVKAAELDPDLPAIASTFHLRGPNYIPLTPAMQEAILESDVGPKLLRYFADNKAEATRLSALSPTTALREMGRIEAQLVAQPKPTPPPVISQAPEPISTVGGPASAGSVTELKDMPMGDFFKLRAPQITKRR